MDSRLKNILDRLLQPNENAKLLVDELVNSKIPEDEISSFTRQLILQKVQERKFWLLL